MCLEFRSPLIHELNILNPTRLARLRRCSPVCKLNKTRTRPLKPLLVGPECKLYKTSTKVAATLLARYKKAHASTQARTPRTARVHAR